ncbi:MAG: polymerase sigma factor [Solirubrobacteraceae bacterium]|nr:polymerase sigma factor [Solirubrobacteraceae bacterium]
MSQAEPQQHSDAELLRRMNAGSTAAFGELYDRYAARALRVARSVSRNPGTAEEAVQDAFEAIWKSRCTYRADRGPVAPWAMAIVRHRALALAGRRGFPLAGPAVWSLPEPASPAEEIVDAAVAQDEARLLRGLLARIPVGQREVITLAFYGQLTHAEIAERLGLPAGTVKGRMRLGLGKLRADLERAA